MRDKENAAKVRHIWRKNRYATLREHVNRLKCAPCLDCGQRYNPWQMEYDHRDPRMKKRAIASLINRCCSLALLQTELEKCDLVCSNCHAGRAHRRRILKSVEA